MPPFPDPDAREDGHPSDGHVTDPPLPPPSDGVGDDVQDPPRDSSIVDGPTPGLQTIHRQLLEPRCGACHMDLSPPAGNLSMRWDNGLRDRLLAPSLQVPSMPRVTPGDIEESYLWHKVRGTHDDQGGSGARMPLDDDPLGATDLRRLERWIQEGAPLADGP